MPQKVRMIILIVVGWAVPLIVLLSNNSQIVPFHIFTAELSIGIGVLVLMFYAIGALFGFLYPIVAGKQEQNIAKLKEWQEQDQKLAIEVQKDKEKQLEAKIATLEAALKQALKK
ncbi:MAG: hypothetical protein K2X77_26565 [Candidatus Obscuribacterales bacterium]|nr:hypothetical protein [Candidatus Obscuribacterales bacterium]